MKYNPFTWRDFDGDNPAHIALQGFILFDIQQSSRHAEQFLGRLRAYQADKKFKFAGSCNVFSFECVESGLLLEPLYSGQRQEPCIIDYLLVEQVLREWSRLCDNHPVDEL